MSPITEFLMEHEAATKVFAAAWYGAAAVVSFMVLTRRGWWKRTGPELDWTTTADCPRCNEHGPYPWWERDALPSSPERARDMHQAWHGITTTLLEPVVRLLDRTAR